MESFEGKFETKPSDKWEMDDEMRQHLIDLGIMNDDGSEKPGEEFRDYK